MRRGNPCRRVLPAAPLLLSGCMDNPSVLLNSAGPAAADIERLTWLFIIVCGVVWVLVVLAFLLALHRGRNQPQATAPPARVPALHDRARLRLITGALVVTTIILSVFVGASYTTDRVLIALERQPRVEVTLTAHQWWWEIRYEDPVPSKIVLTANELHLPLGEPVKLSLVSLDVIHSLWIPNVAGKRDIIPGRDNTIWLTAAKAGEWHGRCAEFCGFQHAHMALDAVAVPAAEFESWRESRLKPAPTPTPEDQLRSEGMQVFLTSPCVMCHTIRGTSASSRVGPDLTHVAGRRTIAAGTLPYSRGNLGGWIVNPQSIKPGSQMPDIQLEPDQLQALLAYLDSLT
jgi:cytochrome c oxidase subunit II